MLEKVEQPKRKRGERGEETAQDVIVRELTQKRIDECRKLIAEGSENLRRIRGEMQLFNSPNPPPELLKKIWQRKLAEEAEAAAAAIRHEEWLKERDVKIAAAKIATRQTLLRSSRIQHAPLPAAAPPAAVVVVKVEETVQPATPAVVPETQDECSVQSATDSTAPTTPVAQNPPLTSPLLTHLLQSPSGPTTPYKDAKQESVSPAKAGTVFFANQQTLSALSAARQLVPSSLTTSSSSPSPAKASAEETSPSSQAPSASPTLSKLLELPLSSASANKLPPLPASVKTETDQVVDLTDDRPAEVTDSETIECQREDAGDVPARAVVTAESKEEEKNDDVKANIRTQDEGQEIKTPLTRRLQRELRGRPTASPAAVVAATVPPPITPIVAATSAPQPVTPAAGTATPAGTVASSSASVATRRSGRIRGIRDVSESEPTLPEKKASLTEDPNLIDASASEESMDAVTRTNVSSKAPSVSDSIPNSPASTMHSEDTDIERDRKRWQRYILGLLRLAMTHQYAAVFMHPAHKEVGDDYKEAIKRPVDLMSIKKRVENQAADNAIRTTAEFQREMMLLFQNALMYNKKGHDVHEIALEMQKEIGDAIEEFVLSEKQAVATGQPSTSGGKTGSGTETPVAPKQRIRDRRPAAASVQTQDDAAVRRRSRTSTDTDPGTPSSSVPLTRTALKKKATG